MSEWTSAGMVAAGQFSDPEHARLIYLAAGGLLVAGVVLAVGTWYWWRSAKVEHPALGPLEVMGTRRWWRSDFTERVRRLEVVRPVPAAEGDLAPVAPELIDLDLVHSRELPPDFGDLADPTGGTVIDAELDVEAILDAATVPAPEPEAVPSGDDVSADADASEEAVAEVVPEVIEPQEPAAEVAVEPEPEPVPEPAVEVAAVAAVSEPVAVEPVAVESPSGGMLRSIVIDTSPRARDAEADAPLVDATPSSAPIDPLLRLWSE